MARSSQSYLFAVLLLIAGLLAVIAVRVGDTPAGALKAIALACMLFAAMTFVRGLVASFREGREEAINAEQAPRPVRRAPDPEPRRHR